MTERPSREAVARALGLDGEPIRARGAREGCGRAKSARVNRARRARGQPLMSLRAALAGRGRPDTDDACDTTQAFGVGPDVRPFPRPKPSLVRSTFRRVRSGFASRVDLGGVTWTPRADRQTGPRLFTPAKTCAGRACMFGGLSPATLPTDWVREYVAVAIYSAACTGSVPICPGRMRRTSGLAGNTSRQRRGLT